MMCIALNMSNATDSHRHMQPVEVAVLIFVGSIEFAFHSMDVLFHKAGIDKSQEICAKHIL